MGADLNQRELKGLPVLLPDGFQDQAGEQGLQGGDGGEAADNQGGELGHQAGEGVNTQHRDEKDGGKGKQNQTDDAEKAQGIVNPVKSCDGSQHLKAVGVGVQLGNTALGTIPVVNDHIFQVHIVHNGMDAHFRFNFKALGDDGEGFHKLVAEGPVACHNVLDVVSEQQLNAAPDQTIAQIVEGTGVFGEIGGGKRRIIAFNEDNEGDDDNR